MDKEELEKIQRITEKFKVPKATDSILESVERMKSSFSAMERLNNYRMPEIAPDLIIPKKPEKENEYQSASVLMEAISSEAITWKNNLPDNFRPAILAILYGGIQIQIESLAQISFHGIRISGRFNGAPCSMRNFTRDAPGFSLSFVPSSPSLS